MFVKSVKMMRNGEPLEFSVGDDIRIRMEMNRGDNPTVRVAIAAPKQLPIDFKQHESRRVD